MLYPKKRTTHNYPLKKSILIQHLLIFRTQNSIIAYLSCPFKTVVENFVCMGLATVSLKHLCKFITLSMNSVLRDQVA